MRRIAVWNTAFLGDALLTLPLIQSLRLRYPQATVDFYVRGGLEPLFRPHPDIASVYAYDKRGGQKGVGPLLSLGRDILGRGYDLWISAHTSPRSGFFSLLSRAPLRIGYRTPPLSRFFYTDLVERHFFQMDEVERLLELLRPLGDGPVSGWPELALAPEAKAEADLFFSGLARAEGGLPPLLGLHPGSVWGSKRWPAAYFADIAVRSLDDGAHVLLFAGKGEEAVAAEVRGLIAASGRSKGRLHDFSGRLPLPLLAAWIERLSCYLTNDSGPMHIAWALRTPVTALFGPTVRSLGFFPRGASRVFEVPLECRPCGLHGPAVCPLGHHRCMVDLLPDMVWPDVRRKLHAFGSQPHVSGGHASGGQRGRGPRLWALPLWNPRKGPEAP